MLNSAIYFMLVSGAAFPSFPKICEMKDGTTESQVSFEMAPINS